MAGYSYPTYARGALPTTRVHEAPVHRCGRCANPYTYGNPRCENAPRRTT